MEELEGHSRPRPRGGTGFWFWDWGPSVWLWHAAGPKNTHLYLEGKNDGFLIVEKEVMVPLP